MPDLGTKYECTGCGTKFYDMGRADAICPKCGLNPLTEEVEEIGEEEPAEPEPEPEEGGAPSEDDDDVDVDIDLDEDEGEGGNEGEDEDEDE